MRLLTKFNVPKLLLTANLNNRDLRYRQTRSTNSHEETKNATDKHYEDIAQIYNKFNDVVTIGLHRRWRKAIMDNITLTKDSQILDAPGGTGMNTSRMLELTKHFESDSKFQISVFDASPYMLKIGEDNCKRLGYNPKFVKFIAGDLEKLPFPNESFNTAITSFGLIAPTDFNLMFSEIYRVLKPNGKYVVFDFCYSQNPTIIQRLYVNYIQHIASIIERIKWGNLEPSNSKFVTALIRDTLAKIDIEGTMRNANFRNIEYQPLSLGIAGITIGYKI